MAASLLLLGPGSQHQPLCRRRAIMPPSARLWKVNSQHPRVALPLPGDATEQPAVDVGKFRCNPSSGSPQADDLELVLLGGGQSAHTLDVLFSTAKAYVRKESVDRPRRRQDTGLGRISH